MVQFRIAQQLCKLVASLDQSLAIATIDYVHQDVGILEVIFPVRSNLALAADVPNIQLEAVGHDRFNVETGCWCDLGNLLASELLQKCGFAGIVETQQQDADFLFRCGAQLAQ